MRTKSWSQKVRRKRNAHYGQFAPQVRGLRRTRRLATIPPYGFEFQLTQQALTYE